jgi:hypothetical protein
MQPIISTHAKNQWIDLIWSLRNAGTYPLSVILQCDQEIQDLLSEVMTIPKDKGKQDDIDRKYGTKSVVPSKTFKIRVRYKYQDWQDLPMVGCIASTRRRPDIRF